MGFARVDEQLEVDRAPIRALAKVAVKARRGLGSGSGAGPQTPTAPGAVPGGLHGGAEHERDIALPLDSISYPVP